MKIAISASGNSMESNVDLRFGRCPFFIIAETEGNEIKSHRAIENPAMNQGGGAGIAAAQLIADEKAEAVITGNVGPNAHAALEKAGIRIYIGTGTAEEALHMLIEGKLNEAKAPTGGPGARADP